MRLNVIGGLSVVVLVVCVGICAADTIGLYSESYYSSCNIVDNAVGLLSIRVVHISPGGATASAFSAPMPSCMTGVTWYQDRPPWEVIGSTQTGIEIGYGSCKTGVIQLMSIWFFSHGTSDPCCLYPLLPHPAPWAEGKVQVVDCNFNMVPAVGLVSTINGNETCPCGYPVPVEETTWGQVKALYSE